VPSGGIPENPHVKKAKCHGRSFTLPSDTMPPGRGRSQLNYLMLLSKPIICRREEPGAPPKPGLGNGAAGHATQRVDAAALHDQSSPCVNVSFCLLLDMEERQDRSIPPQRWGGAATPRGRGGFM